MKEMTIETLPLADCTVGVGSFAGFRFFSLELPWVDNERDISCIPEGTYTAHKRISPKNGEVLELIGVDNRRFIQMHAGNFTSDILGCILVGSAIKDINGDNVPDVANSKRTLKRIFKLMGTDTAIKVHIKGKGRS